MANTIVNFKDVRFVIQDETTDVFVLCECENDAPVMLEGWHHKSFPASIPIYNIISKHMFQGDTDSDPMFWPKKVPDQLRDPVELASSVGELVAHSMQYAERDPMLKGAIERAVKACRTEVK